jgi:carboxylate-amine ligase
VTSLGIGFDAKKADQGEHHPNGVNRHRIARRTMVLSVNALRLAPDWSQWVSEPARRWSVQISEDVLVVDPEGGELHALVPEAVGGFGPLLRPHARLGCDGSVVRLTTDARGTVAEAIADASQLRSELARSLRSGHGLEAVTTGMHPWSDAACGTTIAVCVPDEHAAVRALDGLRLHLPLILALAANSPFWRGRASGFASTRMALRANGGLPRSFGSYAEYVSALDALIRAGAIPSAGAVGWDARLRPERGVIEVLAVDSQTGLGELTGLTALILCLTRLHAERDQDDRAAIPELVLQNRAAAIEKGVRADLIDSAGHFVHSAADELALVIEGCAPIARELGCSRELAGVKRNATDPGHSRQCAIAANAGLDGLMSALTHDFTHATLAAVSA